MFGFGFMRMIVAFKKVLSIKDQAINIKPVFEFQPFKDWTAALSKEIIATEKLFGKNIGFVKFKVNTNGNNSDTDNNLIQETGIFLLATHNGNYDLGENNIHGK
ncbi:13404_t:CDS:2 [Entrophospora sp. SA101]|nr:13404_t:CDS:2 [Entrophospora sp. SA101]